MHAKIISWKVVEYPDNPVMTEKRGILASFQGKSVVAASIKSADDKPLYQGFSVIKVRGRTLEFDQDSVALATHFGVQLPRTFEEIAMVQMPETLVRELLRSAAMARSYIATSAGVDIVLDMARETAAA